MKKKKITTQKQRKKTGFALNPQNINRNGAPLKQDRFGEKFLSAMGEEDLIKYLVQHIKRGGERPLIYALDRIYGKVKEQLEVPQLEGIKIIFEDVQK